MATWLDGSRAKKEQVAAAAAQGQLTPAQAMWYQELLYRIEVLETCRMLCKTAPVTTDVKPLGEHYHLVDAYIQCISRERRFGPPAGEKQKAGRKTAADAMEKVLADGRKRFSSFRPSGGEQYKRNISALMNTVLPVWLQLRNAYINIDK